MNTTEFAKLIAQDTGLTQAQARKALNALAHNIAQAFQENQKVQIHGLGTFDTKFSQGRKLNAAMGGGVSPDRIRPVFRPSKTLKDAVNDQ